MKKLILSTVILALAACSSVPSNLSKQDFVGEWSCTMKYENIGVGTVDLLYLRADGTVKDENFIFDHSLNRYADSSIKDYFHSPLKYLTISHGTWIFDNNHLTYKLKKQSAQRLIYSDTFAKLQRTKSFKDIEAKAFSVYSAGIGQEDSIEVQVTKYSKDKFTVVQFADKKYEGQCVRKDKADHQFNGFLEALKEHFKVK
ncbi:conserved domain protein [Haemophilus pittmaniae HK 85]|uniref:Conserved domain protein n=1 Tax=Haemophilus pittmaniae HK 85 TaxID=1035188 RepID=F9QA01_9PAST|nr:hypothetical protein [Haemophilus pittmaniae]EGV05527.1 conserved domain protein [Haemophilus pittmaniae HK 85]SNV76644.1 Uncharacterised protein [Haemophilus pittmaniae]